jgi:outer membrane lipoprotein-sorting protein
MNLRRIILIITMILLIVFSSLLISQEPPIDVNEVLDEIDEKLSYEGDFKAEVTFIQQKINENTKEKEKTVKIAELFRKDEEDKFLMIFTSPKVDAGKGYLYVDENLWFYDSQSREFTKKTVSESIGGTDSKQRDLEKSKLTDYFDFEYAGEDTVGKIECYTMIGRAKDLTDLEYPVTKIWVNKRDLLPLKREEYTVAAMDSEDLSDVRPSQTVAYLKYTRVKDEKSDKDVIAVQKMVVVNNREKGRMTVIETNDIELKDLPDNIFTKAYLENRSN